MCHDIAHVPQLWAYRGVHRVGTWASAMSWPGGETEASDKGMAGTAYTAAELV